MSHMVIYRSVDGKPGFQQTDDLVSAVELGRVPKPGVHACLVVCLGAHPRCIELAQTCQGPWASCGRQRRRHPRTAVRANEQALAFGEQGSLATLP